MSIFPLFHTVHDKFIALQEKKKKRKKSIKFLQDVMSLIIHIHLHRITAFSENQDNASTI
jgi:hypothetical protein